MMDFAWLGISKMGKNTQYHRLKKKDEKMVMNDWMIGYHDFGNPHDLSNPAAQRLGQDPRPS
jgi:hypothetical protein